MSFFPFHSLSSPLVLTTHSLAHFWYTDICLEPNCLTPEREYPRRHEWIKHVRQNHWTAYQCRSCELACSSSLDFKRHLKISHLVDWSAAEMDAMVKLCEHPVLDVSKVATCPLCHETLHSVQQYLRHVGRHQEQLSLFALPSMDTDADGQPEGSGGSDSEDVASDQRPSSESQPAPQLASDIFVRDILQKQEDIEEEPYTIKCICGGFDDDGNTILCEACYTWQHIMCYYPDNVDDAHQPDFVHLCAECALVRRRVVARQQAEASVIRQRPRMHKRRRPEEKAKAD